MALDRINRVLPVGGSDRRPVEGPAGQGKKGLDTYTAARAGLGRITGAAAPVGAARFLAASPAVDPIVGSVRALNLAACEAQRPAFVAAIEQMARGA